MSRIGKLPITIPNGVTVTINGQTVMVKGPKGELQHTVNPEIKVEQNENQIVLTARNDSQEARSLYGLNRTLVANLVIGVTDGFKIRLEIQGVGYRANVQGNKLVLSLGFSHPVEHPIPNGIEVKMDEESKNVIIVTGIDKQLVGQQAAVIRGYRKPEPYKGKGIRYEGEYVRRKTGKAAGS